jgi:hypothetical protein
MEMQRTDYPSIADISREVMTDIDVEKRIKTAEVDILRKVANPAAPQGITDLSKDLRKLAHQLRTEPDDDITYGDIDQFMRAANASVG